MATMRTDMSGYLNDLWEFNPSLSAYGEWVWMGGSNTQSCTTISSVTYCEIPGVYGALGTPAAGNTPEAGMGLLLDRQQRQSLALWWLWLRYRRNVRLSQRPVEVRSSLGVYGEWTWMGGSNTVPEL